VTTSFGAIEGKWWLMSCGRCATSTADDTDALVAVKSRIVAVLHDIPNPASS
jgi:hypothetical protein